MKSLTEIMDSWTKEDWDRIATDFGNQLKAERAEKAAFYESDKCEHIISRILATNKGLECDDPHYHYDVK